MFCRIPSSPDVDRGRRRLPPDGVQQGHSVVGQQGADAGEEAPVVRPADMLEHADGDDPVVSAARAAVVFQSEIRRAAFSSPASRPAAASPRAARGEGDTRDVHAVVARQIERHAAEAAADVEHRSPGRPMHVSLAAMWRFLASCASSSEACSGVEVRTGVLHVLVEEAAVEVGRMIVVVVHVAPRPPRQIDDGGEPRHLVEPLLDLAGAPPRRELLVEQHEVEKIRVAPPSSTVSVPST